jgi:hypothetical protein
MLSKFIIMEDCAGVEAAVVFPGNIKHSDAVSLDAKPVAAGFWYLNHKSTLAVDGVVVVEGIGSSSLNLFPRAGDARLIAQTLRSFPHEYTHNHD